MKYYKMLDNPNTIYQARDGFLRAFYRNQLISSMWVDVITKNNQRVKWSPVGNYPIPDTAALLFTGGDLGA